VASRPKYALKFLRWFCREDYLEEIEGDLTEIFEKNCIRSPRYARWKFMWNVMRYFRPEFIKSFKSSTSINHTDMLRHNLLIAFRNIQRHKGSFFINLIGLSTGLACGLLIYLWVNDELRMDRFHKNADHIFQVLTNHPSESGIDTWNEGPIPLGPALKEEMPEVEQMTNASPIMPDFVLSAGNLHVTAAGQFVDQQYFTVFSYNFLQGDPAKVMADKSVIVISESMALKLFGTTHNVLGKSIEWQYENFKRDLSVAGIFRDITSRSSDQFDFAISFEILKEIIGRGANWGNQHARIYLILKDETDIPAFGERLRNFLKTKDSNSDVTLLLQRYANRYLYGKFENGIQSGGRIGYVVLFSITGVFIVFIACINFMNLSTAKASRRLKEVGIKKVVGAYRSSLVWQYLQESLFITIFSFSVALAVVWILLPEFNIITGKQLSLELDKNILLAFLLTIVVTGLTAGSYPALYLSAFKPVSVLKGKLITSFGDTFIRKGLVVLQFTLSVTLIALVMVVYKQIELIQTKNLGYDRDNVIYFKAEGLATKKVDDLIAEIKNIPGVVNASSMWGSIVGETGVTRGYFNWEGKDPNAVITFSHFGVNYELLELLGIKMKEGRTFSREFATDSTKIILNEAAIQVMGLKDPVGKKFNLWGNEMEIIGVTENFNFRSLHEEVKPFFFRLLPKETSKIMIKLKAGSERETLAKLKDFYAKVNPGFVLDYQFLDHEYQQQYTAELRVSLLSRYFAGIAILISALGLFGLASFSAERRIKEIGIRKILGSSETRIVFLLSRDFTQNVVLAIAIGWPLSFFLASKWLEGFVFRIELHPWYFLLAGGIALLIAWTTVVLQTLKAARINPAQCLRNE
jgi:ABC-type antimicrobial peptide transport system permease subunit